MQHRILSAAIFKTGNFISSVRPSATRWFWFVPIQFFIYNGTCHSHSICNIGNGQWSPLLKSSEGCKRMCPRDSVRLDIIRLLYAMCARTPMYILFALKIYRSDHKSLAFCQFSCSSDLIVCACVRVNFMSIILYFVLHFASLWFHVRKYSN